MRFLRGIWFMYRYCRVGHGYPNGRWYSLCVAAAMVVEVPMSYPASGNRCASGNGNGSGKVERTALADTEQADCATCDGLGRLTTGAYHPEIGWSPDACPTCGPYGSE